MPLAVFQTNIKAEAFNDDFAVGLTNILADRLHRDGQDISVHIHPSQILYCGGTKEPSGYLILYTSRGFGDIERRRQLSQAILDFIKDKLKVPNLNRFMVYMQTTKADDIGLDGGLLSDRYGCMAEGGPFDVRYSKRQAECSPMKGGP
ncbi:macrophage migration inhibitory factor homolog [Diadema antillarum]|uniref:macrophage migration inhibitory factor homolog n=1 Tax=Diadema antillarum TaxID=105358 RepID=UPI003A8437F7